MTENYNNNSSFVFIMPVRNPDDRQVTNYGTIELLLKQTLLSLCEQTYENIHIIVVCHRIPQYAEELPDNIRFLNIAESPVFASGRNHVRVDKGLKYITGIMYAERLLKPAYIMPMDADDYIHTDLAKTILGLDTKLSADQDGFIVHRGVHVSLNVVQGESIEINQAYTVNDFHLTCGSCRALKARRLITKLKNEIPGIEAAFQFDSDSKKRSPVVSLETIDWLDRHTRHNYNEEESILNGLGRHMTQSKNFSLKPIGFIGAAKGCGHGNHDGPLRGDIHNDKIISLYNNNQFKLDFGLNNIARLSYKRNFLYDVLSLPRYYIYNRLKFALKSSSTEKPGE